MFVIYYTKTNPGLSKQSFVVPNPDYPTVDLLETVCKYAQLSCNDSVWIPPCCYSDHE